MPTIELSSAQVDRVAGSLVGLAAGDALGAGYEFGPPLTETPVMKGGGAFGWKPGEWTDDTQMAICVARVTSTGSVDATEIAGRFLDWYRSHPPDVGNQTRAVLSGSKEPADVAARSAAHYQRSPRNSAGNGSLMRTGPIALACLGDDTKLAAAARQVSDLTHGDPMAGDACVLWCVAIDRAVREARLDGIRDGLGLLLPKRREAWVALIDEAETKPPSTFARNGYVVTALQAAHSSVFHTTIPPDTSCLHFQHALQRAVQIGDDTDTVAAIAGALLGARWGLTAIPAGWVTMLHGWPGIRASGLVCMAVLTSSKGTSDGAGWPGSPSLLGYYAANFGSRVVDVPLPDDPGVRIGNVAALAALDRDPPDVVVSLCRIGRDDVPEGVLSCQPMLMDQSGAEHNPNLDFVLGDLAGQMVAWRDAGKTVFLHCVQAESRTPTVAAGYLAERLGISGKDALHRVRSLVPGAHPNSGFTAALDRLWPR